MAPPRAAPERPDAKAAAAAAARPRTYPPGSRVPGTVYEIHKILGAGGMGTVYEVEDTSVGKRYVLKTLHPELGDRQDLARRMQNEARTLARLQHPNIVEVVTAGVTADELKLPFYVMERLEGQNIRVVIEKMGRLSTAHAVRITIDLLDALDRAHESGVVHRDVKPDNIFLHRAPSGSTVTKLLDFGIMRLLDGSRGDTAGRFLGTLRYAAPEQLRGEVLSPQTDLYAAGLVLFEMIAGRGPFDDLGNAAAIGRAHIKEPPPPLSSFAPDVPPELVRIVDQALAKDATLRQRDAFTFAGELRGLQKLLKPPAPSGAVPSKTMATEVNVLGSIETAVEPRSVMREPPGPLAAPRPAAASSTHRVAPVAIAVAAAPVPVPSAPPGYGTMVSRAGGDGGHPSTAPTRSEGLAGATDAVEGLDLGFQPTEHGESAFSEHGQPDDLGELGTEASVVFDASEDVKVESLVDRYALTRTSAEEEQSIGVRRPREPFLAGMPAGDGRAGDTEEYVLPAKAPVEVAVTPYVVPPSQQIGAMPPSVAASFAAVRPLASNDGRNDPTVRRGRSAKPVWIAAGVVAAMAASFGFYRLGTRNAAGDTAATTATASSSATAMATASATATATATAAPPAPTPAPPLPEPATPTIAATTPPPADTPSAPPAASAPAPAPAPSPAPSPAPVAAAPATATQPKAAPKTPRPATHPTPASTPPRALAGPPRVSSGL